MTVQYQTEEGEYINSESVEYAPGNQTVYPNWDLIPEGYELLNQEASVTVNDDGSYDPNPVVFTLRKQVSNAWVTVQYQTEEGEYINGESVEYAPGNQTVYPNWDLIPEGYELLNQEASVTVNDDGSYDPNPVVFTLKAIQTEEPDQPEEPDIPDVPDEPVEVTVTVYYVGADGYPVLEESFTYGEGSHTVAARQIDGYTLNEGQQLEHTVVIDAAGNASTTTIMFYVTKSEEQPDQPTPPAEATVYVDYVDASGSAVLEENFTYTEGTHTVSAHAIEGYTLNSDQQLEQTVTVYSDGTISPETITFFVTKIEEEQPDVPQPPTEPEQPETPDQPALPGLPADAQIVETFNCQGKTTGQGLNFRKGPDRSYGTYGKISVTGTVVDVHALVRNASGADWYCITYGSDTGYVSAEFLELISSEPVTADVTFRYVDTDGAQLLSDNTVTLSEGVHNTADYVAAVDGHTYVSASAETVNITASGADVTEVVFTYQRNTVTADITFRYVDTDGAQLLSDNTVTLSEGVHNTADYIVTVDGYTYVSASAETVNITASGADVTEIVLTYSRNPVTAKVNLYFVDENGSHISEGEVITLSEGSHGMVERQRSIAGYTFQYVTPETVNVSASGADVTDVTFNYKRDPVTADVTFRYVDENGAEIAASAVTPIGEGSHNMADYQQSIDGYVFASVAPATLNVGASGADSSEVVFSYTKKIISAQVTFLYADDQGNAIPGMDARVETLGEGSHDTAAYAHTAPQGYLYSGVSAPQIIVDETGATPSEVLFTYTRLPENVTVPVYYLDADRNPVMEGTSIQFTAADFGKVFQTADYVQPAPSGYEYAGVSSDTITVDERGGVTPQAIEFTYTLKPAAKATVTFEYLSTDGRKVADPVTVELPEGVHDVMEYAAAPEKYTFQSVSSPNVTITAEGKADPALVTFTYAPVKDKAVLKVHYRNAIGESFANSPEIRELPVGEHIITPNVGYAPGNNYALSATTQSYTVKVGSDLVAEPNSVYFTYYDASVTADVTVRYLDSLTGETILEEVRKLTPGTHELAPNEELLKTKGNYQRSAYNSNSRIIVSETGKADYQTVIFYYEPADNQEHYLGYLLVTRQTALRQQANAGSPSQMVLPVETVLLTNGQQMSGATEWYSVVVQNGSGRGKLGWVSGSDVRRISSEEAGARLEESSEPEQNPGLYITIMDGVPLRRYKTTASEAKYLKINVVVTVSGQEYDDAGYLWHRTSYDGVDGYVRDGQLRKLTTEEVDDYIASGGNTSSGNPDKYDPNGASSYGYVSTDGVNFRSTPGGNRLKMLNKYAMALIIGTKEVNGVTWYNVNYSGQIGWIHGDYFHQMSLTEFSSFMGSNEYYQGIANNTTPSAPSVTAKPSGSTGSATQGNVSSVEDWNVGAWQNTGVTTQSTYQPFNPYATPAATAVPNGTYTTQSQTKLYQSANTNSGSVTLPANTEIKITGTVTLSSTRWYAVSYDGKTGYIKADELGEVSATPTPAPTSTFVIGTMIPINYEDESKETQTSNVPWGLLGGAVVLVGGAGGVYAYALNQNKRRKAAAARAAAARRAQAAQANGGNASPYARRAVAAAPAAAQQRPQTQPVQQRTAAPMSAPQNTRNPYSSGSITGSQQANPYSRPGSYGAAGAAGAAMASQQNGNPYAAPRPSASTQENANPYAAPVQDAPQIVNPYASRADAPVSNNPYARPIGTVSASQPMTAPKPLGAEQSASDAPASPRRRATRMERYHAAENGENGDNA